MKKGFTLIELMAVIAILGLLAAFSTVAVNNIRKREQEKNKKNTIVGILTGAKEYYADKRSFPEEGVSVSDLLENDYVSIDITKNKDLIYNGSVEIKVKRVQCPTSLKYKYYLDKNFTENNTTIKYNDCGCEEQGEVNTNTPNSNILCTN